MTDEPADQPFAGIGPVVPRAAADLRGLLDWLRTGVVRHLLLGTDGLGDDGVSADTLAAPLPALPPVPADIAGVRSVHRQPPVV